MLCSEKANICKYSCGVLFCGILFRENIKETYVGSSLARKDMFGEDVDTDPTISLSLQGVLLEMDAILCLKREEMKR